MSTTQPEDPRRKYEAMIAAHPELRREAYEVVLETIRFLQEKQENHCCGQEKPRKRTCRL